MKFAIRDDDVSYFTSPQELIGNYNKVWDVCPVSLSVVPFHACTKSAGIPREYWSSKETFPVGDNKELVSFLRDKIKCGKVSITLHGYSHKDNHNTYEFDTKEDLTGQVKHGKEYLESLFDIEVKVFVPPHNTISSKGMEAVIANGLNIVNIASFRLGKRPFHLMNIIPFIKQRVFKLKYKRKYPYVLDCYNHKEISYYSLTPDVSYESLKEDFDFCREMNGSFILATHYWEFAAKQSYDRNVQMGEVFNKFWEYVNKQDNISFVSVNSIFESNL